MPVIRSKYLFLLCWLFASCKFPSAKSHRVIAIQPFGDFSPALTNTLFKQIKAVNPATVLRPPLPLPSNAYYTPRHRYRADSLIQFLKTYGSGDTVLIGLTHQDISTTKGEVHDWGVMGLGYRPGNACVVSTFRLAKSSPESQFYKVAIHELGHTQGLPHCPVKTCFMRDAEGGNPLNEEIAFCASCKTFLIDKGWQLK